MCFSVALNCITSVDPSPPEHGEEIQHLNYIVFFFKIILDDHILYIMKLFPSNTYTYVISVRSFQLH